MGLPKDGSTVGVAKAAVVTVLLAIITGVAIAAYLVHPLLLVAFVIVCFWVVAPAYIGSRMGRIRSIGESAGGTLGLFLGWFGLLIIILYPVVGERVHCPYCDELISATANVCKHCHRKVLVQPDFDD